MTATKISAFAAASSVAAADQLLVNSSNGDGTYTTKNVTVAIANTNQTHVNPALGTPASGVLTNCTGLPVGSGVSGLGTGIATWLATPSSANLRAAMTDESGSGALLFANGALGTPASGTLSSCTGLPISTGVSGLGTGVATLLAGTSSGTGGPVGTASPTLTGSLTINGGSTAGVQTFNTTNANGIYTQYQNSGVTIASVGAAKQTIGGLSASDFSVASVGAFYLDAAGSQHFSISGIDKVLITGTGINSTNIGATTPGSLAATTGTFSGVVTLTSANGEPLRLNGATTGTNVISLANSGGSAYFGQENSAGNNIIVGSTAYDTCVRGPSGISFSADAGNTRHMRLSNAGNLNVAGLGDFGGLRANGTSLAASGAGVEMFYSGGTGFIFSYDRTGGAYRPLEIRSTQIVLNPNNTGNIFIATPSLVTVSVPLVLGNYTVGTLPSSPGNGATAFVTDANATTFASTVAGGGSNKVPVYYDGAWKIG